MLATMAKWIGSAILHSKHYLPFVFSNQPNKSFKQVLANNLTHIAQIPK